MWAARIACRSMRRVPSRSRRISREPGPRPWPLAGSGRGWSPGWLAARPEGFSRVSVRLIRLAAAVVKVVWPPDGWNPASPITALRGSEEGLRCAQAARELREQWLKPKGDRGSSRGRAPECAPVLSGDPPRTGNEPTQDRPAGRVCAELGGTPHDGPCGKACGLLSIIALMEGPFLRSSPRGKAHTLRSGGAAGEGGS